MSRIARILRLSRQQAHEDIEFATAGDIVAVVGIKKLSTGDTFCDEANPILLLSIKRFPEPVISIAVEAKSRDDQERLAGCIDRFLEEDPSLRVKIDEESGQTILSGMGELHLEIIIDRMSREYSVNTRVGKPQVAYRETITKSAQAVGEYVRQSGGHGQYGVVKLKLEPLERGEGFRFVDATKGAAIPREFIPAIEVPRLCEIPSRRVLSRISKLWTSRQRSWTANTTRLTLRICRSKSRPRLRSMSA